MHAHDSRLHHPSLHKHIITNNKQVDVLPSKNQALCDLIYSVIIILLMDMSRD